MSSASALFPLSWAKKSLASLPTPGSLPYGWNLGSYLGLVLGLQLVTGILLSMAYVSSSSEAFDVVVLLARESFFGGLLRWAHLNGATLFFFLIYAHFFRGAINSSFRLFLPWLSGVTILILLMVVAFLGYVLPWGQMSLWGATVITNLLSAIPFMGSSLVIWVWGGFSVGTPALGAFYTFHFLFPFLLSGAALFHMLFLHESGASTPISLLDSNNKTKFHPSFLIKDCVSLVSGLFVVWFVLLAPFKLGDPENFNQASPLSSPLHIQPEWYFLFAYAILRSIPNKLGGVVGLVLSVCSFYLLPFVSEQKASGLLTSKAASWVFLMSFLVLTWIGGNPVEAPYESVGQKASFLYFASLLLLPFL